MAVENLLSRLNIPYREVGLAVTVLSRKPSSTEMRGLKKELQKLGFELIEERSDRLINEVKAVIIEEVFSNEASPSKLSYILVNKLNYDYSHITHIFSEKEGQSIQKFYNAVRIERAKDLILNDEHSQAEIADMLGYSTAAYLSTSFKKATGYTPSQYREKRPADRIELDAI